jgi:hypothetical protein
MLSEFRASFEGEAADWLVGVATLLNPFVVGDGIVLPPLLIGIAASGSRALGQVAKALAEENFPERLRVAIERGLATGSALTDPGLRLEGATLGFGLFSRPGAWNADGILLLQLRERHASTWNLALVS